jgi:hypothetical protein
MYVTCHAYKALWAPFLKLKNKYIDTQIPTYFCTDLINEGDVSTDTLHVLSYGTKSDISVEGNFYDRYLHYLDRIPTEYILYFVDDMFPLAPVSNEALNDCMELMKSDKTIQSIKLSTHSSPFTGPLLQYKGRDFIQANTTHDPYIMNVQPLLLRRDFFIRMIHYCKVYNAFGRQSGNGGLEIYGTEFFRNTNMKCLRVCEDIVKINYAGGIVQSGIISEDAQKVLLTEDIVIETFGNNLIFKLTEDEYSRAGCALCEEFGRRGIVPEK